MLRQIREHDLQHFLVDYLVGPALRCDFIGSRGATDIFRLEATTGFYELHLTDHPPTEHNTIPRLDGSRHATLEGRIAYILPRDQTGAHYYFYKESA